MNDERHNPDVDRLLADAGREWREKLPPSPDAYPEFELRAAARTAPRPGRLVASVGGVLALVAVAVLIVLAMPRSNGQIGGASPSPTGWPAVLYMENRGGPAFDVVVNGIKVATVACGGYQTVAPGASNIPQLPWDLVITRERDGSRLLAQHVTELPRWFVQMGNEPLGLSDAVIMGPIPPTCAPGDPTAKPAVLTPTEAIASVVAFVGEPARTGDLAARDPDGGAVGPFYEVSNSHLVATVDAVTGRLISVVFLGSETPSGNGPSADEAVAIAEAYLTDHGVAFDGMTRTVERKDHGETWEWVVKWVRQAGSVVLPDYREVGVDPAGHVWRYYSLSQPYGSPPVATIDQQAAEAAAKEAAFAGQESRIDSTILRLKVAPNGNQRLVWEITVSAWEASQPSGQGPMLHAFVEVDAQSGVATVIARG
jgi:hypothetical protein